MRLKRVFSPRHLQHLHYLHCFLIVQTVPSTANTFGRGRPSPLLGDALHPAVTDPCQGFSIVKVRLQNRLFGYIIAHMFYYRKTLIFSFCPLFPAPRSPSPRHCERSEAISHLPPPVIASAAKQSLTYLPPSLRAKRSNLFPSPSSLSNERTPIEQY